MSSQVRYFSMFGFLFRYAEWGNRLLMGSLIGLIPFVGPIIARGWHMRTMHRRIRGDHRALPEWSDIGRLLSDGLMPWLFGLIAGMLFGGVFYIVFLVLFFGGSFLSVIVIGLLAEMLGDAGALIGMIIAGVLGLLAFLLIMFLLMVVGTAYQVMLLRVELTGNIGAAFEFNSVVPETKAMFKRFLIGALVMMLVAPFIVLGGELLCLIGLFPAMVILQAASTELRTMVYRSYLLEGGTPVAHVSHLDGGSLIPAGLYQPARYPG